MDTARIAALLEPFLERPLLQAQLEQISIYIDLLLRWNARINLTAIRNPEEIVTRHFGESLFLARHVIPQPSNACHLELQPSTPCHPERSRIMRKAHDPAESKDRYPNSTSASMPAPPSQGAPSKLRLGGPMSALDIGSGAGFPGLPLKIWAPHMHLTLIESNHKKATFLREAARALTLTDVNVITERTEALARDRNVPQAEVVTLRAVEHFESTLQQAMTFLAPMGTLALLIGAPQIPLLSRLGTVKWHPPMPIPQSEKRVLSIGVHQESGNNL